MTRSRAAVIGSGFGGLSLAVRLQAAGIQTTILEKRERPGGRAYVYEDKGYTFDAGPSIIGKPVLSAAHASDARAETEARALARELERTLRSLPRWSSAITSPASRSFMNSGKRSPLAVSTPMPPGPPAR